MVLVIVNTRLLVQLVDTRGFAAHSIIASFATWLALLNLGIPSSVQNLISRWRANHRSLVSLRQVASSLTLICAAVFSPLVLLSAFLVHRYVLVDYSFVSLRALILAFLCMFVGGLGTVYMSMLHAEHRSIWPNFYPAATAVMVFAFLAICRNLAIGDFNFILSAYFLPNALFAVLAFLLLRLRLRVDLEGTLIRQILVAAKGFALLAAMGALTLGLDYTILSRLLPANDVAAYSLTSKMFLVIQAIHAVVLNSSWTPLSDLYFSRQLAAARRRALQLSLIGIALSGFWSLIVVLMAPQLYRLLAPNAVINVPHSLLLLWVGYIVVRVWSDTFYVALQSFGDTSALRKYMLFQAPISVLLQLVLGSRYGMEGLLLGIALSFVLTCAWYLPLRTAALTRVA